MRFLARANITTATHQKTSILCLAQQLSSRAPPTKTPSPRRSSPTTQTRWLSATATRRGARRSARDKSKDENNEEEGQEEEDSGPWNFKQMGRFPRDQELVEVSDKIQFRDHNSRLTEPRWVVDVLKEVDLKRNQLECIALPGSRNPGLLFPICQIINREQQKRELAAKAKAARRTKVMTKEVEINWAITKHDLGHKLKQLLKFLEKGCQCEVTFQHKHRGKKKATQDEMKETAAMVREAVAGIPGVQEYRSADGTVGTSPTCRIFYQAPPKKVAEKVAEKGAEKEPEN